MSSTTFGGLLFPFFRNIVASEGSIFLLIVPSFTSLIPSPCNFTVIFSSDFVFSSLIRYFSDLVLYNGSSIFEYLINNRALLSLQSHFALGFAFPSFTGRPRGFLHWRYWSHHHRLRHYFH